MKWTSAPGFELMFAALSAALWCGCAGEDPTTTGGAAGTAGTAGTGGAPAGGTGGTGTGATAGAAGAGAGGSMGSRGPAYDAGTAACPAADGTRRIKLVNNCKEPRWFKLDGRTTPLWARPQGCPWAGSPCNDLEGVGQCTPIAKDKAGSEDPGLVYCKDGPGGGACACNPHFELSPGEQHEIELPADAAFPSGTGWLAVGCNEWGNGCAIGNDAAKNSTFEFTYDKPGQGSVYYDISAVNAWTTASSVGMRSCGEDPDPGNVFWCRGTGCRFDVNAQCPDGSDAFAGAPPGCALCPTMVVNGKQVLAGSCGTCPDGASANRIPTGTVFNANGVGGMEWTWTGAPDFAVGFGHDEGVHADRRLACGPSGCSPAEPGEATTCLGGCDLCTVATGKGPGDDECIKYCCPDMVKSYGGSSYRFDSAGCTALGVQAGTDYTVAVKTECPYVYTYGYEDHSSTFQCKTSASLLIQACPDPTDFPSKL
jgi:hypothetical protein